MHPVVFPLFHLIRAKRSIRPPSFSPLIPSLPFSFLTLSLFRCACLASYGAAHTLTLKHTLSHNQQIYTHNPIHHHVFHQCRYVFHPCRYVFHQCRGTSATIRGQKYVFCSPPLCFPLPLFLIPLLASTQEKEGQIKTTSPPPIFPPLSSSLKISLKPPRTMQQAHHIQHGRVIPPFSLRHVLLP